MYIYGNLLNSQAPLERAEASCGPVLGFLPPIEWGDPGDPTDILRL